METKDLHIDKSNNLRTDKSNDLHIIAVTGPDINNGSGFRVTIWVSGCTHACPGCQNKHTWKYGQGHKLDDMVPYTNITYKDKILNLIGDEHIDGITISGGDPLDQSDEALSELKTMIEDIKNNFPKMTVWLYTGCTWEELSKKQMDVVRQCDVVVDGKFDYHKKDVTLPFRGSSNQRLIDVKESLKKLQPITIDDEQFKS